APCPECKRILKVPMPVKQEPTDWRKAQARGPSLAKREEEVPEGTWGTQVSRGIVSRESLLEADALPAEREPVTVGRWVRRGVLVAGVLLVAVGGFLFIRSFLTKGQKKDAFDKAMAYVEETKKDGKKEKPKLDGVLAAEVHRAAAEYYLQENDLDNA